MRPVPGLPAPAPLFGYPALETVGQTLLYLHLHLHLFLRLCLWPCFQPLIGLSGLDLDALAVFSWRAGRLAVGTVGLSASFSHWFCCATTQASEIVGRVSPKGAIQPMGVCQSVAYVISHLPPPSGTRHPHLPAQDTQPISDLRPILQMCLGIPDLSAVPQDVSI